MKVTIRNFLVALALFTSLQFTSAFAQGTAFLYQGQLQNNGSPANGSYDFTFTLYNAATAGGALTLPVTNAATTVSNGLFTATIDFGTGPFNGDNRWLEIAVRPHGNGAFSTLSPRQPILPTPYAILAGSVYSPAGSTGWTVLENTNGAPDLIGGSPVNLVYGPAVGATIGGGGATNYNGLAYTNSVIGDFGTVGGGNGNTAGAEAVVGGGTGNTASGGNAFVGGGQGNTASGFRAVVGGGFGNNSGAQNTTVGGGASNTAGVLGATVGGGEQNNASGQLATVSGGDDNTASGNAATVGGGEFNSAGGSDATVGGGDNNHASGQAATVAGGQGNTASGYCSFAGGNSANAVHDGSFVWADNSGGTFSSTTLNQFSVRASGGILFAGDLQLSGGAAYHNFSLSGGNSIGYLYGAYQPLGDGIHLGYNYYYDAIGNGHVFNTGGATSRLSVGYGYIGMYVGGVNGAPSTARIYLDNSGVTVYGTFNTPSDRNAKQDFAPVSSAQILDKVTHLPVSEWSYKEDPKTRHVGPVAQDFYSIFNIGTDDKHIAPIDEGGVALAAIQGLNQKVEDLKAENAELKQRLAALEALVKQSVPDRQK